jgi:hypothetical protein
VIKKRVFVSQEVEVEVDETKFDEAFMQEFRESFYNFHTLDEHIEHLAQLMGRGLATGYSDDFIEGYGRAKDMGIRMNDDMRSIETEILQ